jgi:hypothetical protein
MPSLLSCNRVHRPTTIGTLANSAQMSGSVSVRDLMTLLGPASFGRRPFYVIGHNTNRISEVKEAENAGANVVEPDVNTWYGRPYELRVCHEQDDRALLHPLLVPFLQDLRQVALANPQLALVMFDSKLGIPADGQELLNAIHTHLTPGLDLNVIVSVANLDQASFFDSIYGQLTPREGMMIDEENQPLEVSDYFTKRGVTIWPATSPRRRLPRSSACRWSAALPTSSPTPQRWRAMPSTTC